LEFTETTDVVKLDSSAAIEIAKKSVGDAYSLEAKKISAVLVKYTNNLFSHFPDSKILLKDYPVWVVTFEGVIVKKHGGKRSSGTPQTVFVDTNVIIDANTGDELQKISYSSLIK
jgi:hypothetical protein